MTGRKFFRSPLMKAVSVFMVFAFFSYNINIGFAAVEEDALAPPVGMAPVSDFLLAEDIGVSIDAGTVKNRYNGPRGKMIVHIQDAHCHFEAQSNINKILDQLTREAGIDVISVEGAEGIVDTTWFKAFPDAEIRKEVATYFMKKGEITGAEFFSITTDYDGDIFGAETREYYIDNLKAFTEVYPYKDSIEKYFKDTESISNRLKSIIYPPRLREVDSKIREFEAKEIELSAYAEYLSKTAAREKVDIKEHENFSKLQHTLEYEDKIDFDIVNEERGRYIDVLSKKLPKQEMTDLVTESIKFKKGHVKAVDFYSYLRDLAKENDIDIVHEYPNLFYYYIYTKLYEGIDTEALFKEIYKIETSIKEKLFTDDVQRKLDKASAMLNMYVNLVNIELTNDCYDRLNLFQEKFSLDEVMSFLGSMVTRYNLNYSVEGVPVHISKNLPRMIDFYEIAIKRDEALIENTIKYLEQENKDRGVLIAGGFHTRGMIKMLERKGISYVVVTPRITKSLETPYIKVLTNQRTSLEDIITESAAMPGTAMFGPKEGDMLSPLFKAGFAINLLLSDDGRELEALSALMGASEGGRTFEQSTKELYTDMVRRVVSRWLEKVKSNADPAVWAKASERWEDLLAAFIDRYENALGENAPGLTVETVSEEFKKVFVEATSPGEGAIEADGGRLTDDQHKALNSILAKIISTNGVEPDKSYDPEVGIYWLPGLEEAIIAHNSLGGVQLPGTIVHPGRGREHSDKNIYLSNKLKDAATREEVQAAINHEKEHFRDTSLSEEEVLARQTEPERKAVTSLRVKMRAIADAAQREADAAAERIKQQLLDAAKDMAAAAGADIGPDVVIIVSSSDEQADFWQDRLTGADNVQGSGAVVKKGAVVLSVSESNWEGGAGNGLGTLNGYVQAARKAQKLGIIEVAEGASIEEMVNALMEYCRGKSAFMFHTAGKGTRTAPLPGAEVNSKPNIKLPKMVEVEADGQTKMLPVTILESVLMETNIYAPSRKDRLGVFWGDQIIINENDIAFEGKHHVEIFGQMVTLDPDIKSYGVLIPGEEGDAKQREKLPMEEVQKILGPGNDQVYKSIGSFTISNSFLDAMIKQPEHMKALEDGRGSLNADPDWWQPLTTEREERDEYVEMMGKKGVSRSKAESAWDRMDGLWRDFSATHAADEDGLSRLIGFNDVGQNSLWWDYGQNKFYLENMQVLTEDSVNGQAARLFFGVEDGRWVSGSQISPGVRVENSVVKNSTITRGNLKNCVVIDSAIDDIEAENAVIIGSTIITLRADGALLYNVVDTKESARPGQIIANIFHPEHGRIEMRTDTERDGSDDWNNETTVYDNLYTYSEIAALMGGVTVSDVERVKQQSVEAMRTDPRRFVMTSSERARKLSEKLNIELSEARAMVARRLLVFGEVPFFTPESYALRLMPSDPSMPVTMTEVAIARAELNIMGTRYDDVWRKRRVAFNGSASDYVAEENIVYSAVPARERKEAVEFKKQLGFGTSGLRNFVEDMTDMEVYINARGYMKFLDEQKFLPDGPVTFSINGDRRNSTPRLMRAIARALEDEGRARDIEVVIDFTGMTPTPAGALRGQTMDSFAIVVTGSHIPFDMNGIKFYRAAGEEVQPEDEMPIKAQVALARAEEYEKAWQDSLFDELGMFRIEPEYTVEDKQEEALREFMQRYVQGFPENLLEGETIVYWQHSAVGRDVIPEILRELGASVIPEGRSEEFVAVDTEKIKPEMDRTLRGYAAAHIEDTPLAVVFTDGDSDRPGLADEKGSFLTGDKLGLLVTKEILKGLPDGSKLVVALPVSTNYGVLEELKSITDSRGRPRVDVIKTKIGSPHVVKAMNDSISEAERSRETVYALGWEANGGFLLGSNIQIQGAERPLTRLATRDAVLPLLAAMKLAKDSGRSMSQVIEEEGTVVGNHTGGYDGFLEAREEGGFGLSRDMAMKVRSRIVEMLMPSLEDKKVVAVDFEEGTRDVLKTVTIGREEVDTFKRDSISNFVRPYNEMDKWLKIKKTLEGVFTPERGFSAIKAIDITDGVQVIFSNGEISHLRPSGNDPVFRNYAMSGVSSDRALNQERAREIAVLGENEIIPELGRIALAEIQSSPGLSAILPVENLEEFKQGVSGLRKAVDEGRPIKSVPSFRTGADGYTWGQEVRHNMILDIMGASQPSEKVALAEKHGILPDEVIGERWIGDGDLVIADGLNLPRGILSLWNDSIQPSGLTAKLLSSRVPLSVQYHRFDEMIIPLADGEAYLGMNKDLTADEFRAALESGQVDSVMNRVELKAGVPYIVPAYMVHAYGEVMVYEVKAVTPGQDRAGTVSFFDRLKYLGDRLTTGRIESILGSTESLPSAERLKTRIEALRGLVRENKDLITMPEEAVSAILEELAINDALLGMDPSALVYEVETITETPEGSVFEVMGRTPDFVAARYSVKEGTSIASAEEMTTKDHSLLVYRGEITVIDEKGEVLDTLRQGEELQMHAGVGRYSIRATTGDAVVFTQYVPDRPMAGSKYDMDFEKGSDILEGLEAGAAPAYVSRGVFGEDGLLKEVVDINTEADAIPVVEGREHMIFVEKGTVMLVAEGRELGVLEPGEAFLVSEFSIYDTKGNVFQLSPDISYKLVRSGNGPASVRVEYEQTIDEERAVYGVFSVLKKLANTGRIGQTDILVPMQMYRTGEANDPGSLRWEQKMLERYVSDNVRLIPYDANQGIKSAAKRSVRQGSKLVLIAPQSIITAADRTDAEIRSFLYGEDGKISPRVLAIPDIHSGENREKMTQGGRYMGWQYTREVEGAGIVLASVTPDEIRDLVTVERSSISDPAEMVARLEGNAAADLKKIIAQLTGGKPVPAQYLFYLLARNEIGKEIEKLPAQYRDDDFGWLAFIVKNLLLEMPIKPFDPTEQLQQRRMVMYSV